MASHTSELVLPPLTARSRCPVEESFATKTSDPPALTNVVDQNVAVPAKYPAT